MKRIFQCKREEVTEEWRNIHDEELHNFYSSPNILAIVLHFVLRAMQSMISFGLFCDCSLVPILWLSSPISNAHFLQIFFN
jgi:hypothetical protein